MISSERYSAAARYDNDSAYVVAEIHDMYIANLPIIINDFLFILMGFVAMAFAASSY